LPVIRHITVCALDELGVMAADVDDVALALTEACANVVRHSGVDNEYEVHLDVIDGLCEISVLDTGRGFDSSVLTRGMAPASAEEGRGLALVAALVDRVRFESRPEEGTIVHLVKKLEIPADGRLSRFIDGTAGGDGDGTGTGTGTGTGGH
jgi:serine/threonine-protein kinase RsbW